MNLMTPNLPLVISIVRGILGSVLGSAALAIPILNYLRDRPKLRVELFWDLVQGTSDSVGVIRVSNIGRRSVYFYGASLVFPRKENRKPILLLDTTSGSRLDEGGRPEHFLVKYSDELANYRGD